MERKSKYSLFPAKPSPPPCEPLPPLPETCSPLRPHKQSPVQEPALPPAPSRPSSPSPSQRQSPPHTKDPGSPWPPLNNSWSSREDNTSTLQEDPPLTEGTSTESKMHTPSPSASSSESSLYKPASTTAPQPPPNPRNRPRTVYFHSGIGGAGNYHKAIREDNVLRPMTCSRTNPPRFLSSLFGTLGGKKGRRQPQQQYSGSDGTGSSQSSSNTLPLGAAEVMRRKMLGFGSDGKAKDHGTRG